MEQRWLTSLISSKSEVQFLIPQRRRPLEGRTFHKRPGRGSIPLVGTERFGIRESRITPGSSNGRTRVFEARYAGSTPAPGTVATTRVR